MSDDFEYTEHRPSSAQFAVGLVGGLIVAAVVGLPALAWFGYYMCRIEVPREHIAILTKKTGKNLSNDAEIARNEEFKGVQLDVLPEGRHFRNPWNWDWRVVRQVEIPHGKLGVRVRLYGDELPYGQLVAMKDTQKGIVPGVLNPGRYAINACVLSEKTPDAIFAEHVELHEPVVIPAGFKGVVTKLSAPMPENPNELLVRPEARGVQQLTLDPGTNYVNPYVTRINLVDCRSQRFNLSSGGEMGFPSKDGFWVTLDGIVEFRVSPEEAARVYVTYNDDVNGERIDEEIINKVILPNARSFCRLQGSNHSGRDFISGDTRIAFQEAFQNELAETCKRQGIEIIQALITRINPPQKIAEPVRGRQIALQEELQFQREILQQDKEKELAIELALVKQKPAMIEAQREVVKVITEAEQKREVAVIEANQRLKVAGYLLKAAQDEAAKMLALGEAAAEVIRFNNQAEAAGWQKSVEAFAGDGDAFAQYILLKKLAPSYRRMMINTADSPIMEIFEQYSEPEQQPANQLETP